MTQTDVGYDHQYKMWYIKSYTNTRQFLGVQLVQDSNIKFDNVVADSYSWVHEKYPDKSHGRLRFFDNPVTIEKTGAVADSIVVKGDSDFMFTKLPKGDITLKYNLPYMNWTLEIDGIEYITRNFIGKMTGGMLNDKLRWVIKHPKSVLYSKEMTLIDSNLEVT